MKGAGLIARKPYGKRKETRARVIGSKRIYPLLTETITGFTLTTSITSIELLIILAASVIGAFIAYLFRNREIALDPEESINPLARIFAQATSAIKIATDFDPKFFNHEEVIKGLKRAIDNKVEIKILYEGECLPDGLSGWYEKQAKQGNIEIRHLEKLPYHLMVIDNRHVRLPSSYLLGLKKSNMGLVFKNSPTVAKSYNQRFDELWKKAS
jgi:hypothetical protein